MIKHGADIRGIQPEMAIAYMVTAHVFWMHYGVACVITEGTGATHMAGSLHYQGRALDIRVNNVPLNEWRSLQVDVANALGPQFDVVLETGSAPHLHLEFDPKPKGDPTV